MVVVLNPCQNGYLSFSKRTIDDKYYKHLIILTGSWLILNKYMHNIIFTSFRHVNQT